MGSPQRRRRGEIKISRQIKEEGGKWKPAQTNKDPLFFCGVSVLFEALSRTQCGKRESEEQGRKCMRARLYLLNSSSCHNSREWLFKETPSVQTPAQWKITPSV